MPRERERERKTFLAEIQETEPLFLTSTVEKSLGRLKKETRLVYVAEKVGEGREGRGRYEVEKKLVVR